MLAVEVIVRLGTIFTPRLGLSIMSVPPWWWGAGRWGSVPGREP